MVYEAQYIFRISIRILFLGTMIGTVVCSAFINITKDWTITSYFLGSLGILWFIFWTFLCHSDPTLDPFISEKEMRFLAQELGK